LRVVPPVETAAAAAGRPAAPAARGAQHSGNHFGEGTGGRLGWEEPELL